MSATRGLLFALIGGIASAILSIGLFGSAPILAVGLYLGSAFAGITAGVASLLVLLNFNSVSTVFYIVGTGLPAMLIVRQALISYPGAKANTVSWYPPGHILAWLSAYGLLILGCIGVYFAFSSSTLEGVSRGFLKDLFDQILNHSNTNFRSDADKTAVKNLFDIASDRLAPLLAGYLISFYLLVLVAISTLTQSLLGKAGLSRRPAPSYINLKLPRWLTGAFVACLLVTVLPNAIGILGQNAVLILSIPFLLLGLTVIHTLSRRSPNPGMVLVAIYFALFLFVALINLSLPVLALLVLLGIAEQWTSLRRRLAAPGVNQEDE